MSYGMDYQGGGGMMGGGGGGFNDVGSGGGGFQSGGGSGGTPRARKSYDEQTLIPVTARMILASSGGGSNADGTLALVDGRELHHVKLVGAVRSFEPQSTHTTYSIEDGTGLIDVKQWMDDAHDCTGVAELRQQCLQDHVYVSIVGQVKDYDGKKTLVAHSVRRLSTTNELIHHMLQVVYSAEMFSKKNSIVGGGGSGADMMGSGGGVGFGTAGLVGGAPVAQAGGNQSGHGDNVRDQVLNYIRTRGDDSIGVHIISCIQLLTANGQFTEPQIRSVIDNLASEGHIYSTVDEEHYSFAM